MSSRRPLPLIDLGPKVRIIIEDRSEDETNAFGLAMAKYRQRREAATYAAEVANRERERREREEQERLECEERERQRKQRRADFIAELDAVGDPISRQVLDLHSTDSNRSLLECNGCDYSGFVGEPPEWPCRTVELIAEHHGIDVPTGI